MKTNFFLFPTGWQFSTGFINDQMISQHLYPADKDTIVLMCGPPPMINLACQPALDKLEYHPDQRFAY